MANLPKSAPRVPAIGPDVELLAAWNRYLDRLDEASEIDLDAARAEGADTDPGQAFFNAYVDPAAELVRGIPAKTPAGLAVKSRFLFMAIGEELGHENVILGGAPITPDLLGDARHRLIWTMIGDAERMAAQQAAAAAPPLNPIETRLRTFEFNEGWTEADNDEREQQVEEWSDLTDQLIALPGAAVTKLMCLVRRMEQGNPSEEFKADFQDYQLAVSALRDLQKATATPRSGADLDAWKRPERHRAKAAPRALAAE